MKKKTKIGKRREDQKAKRKINERMEMLIDPCITKQN